MAALHDPGGKSFPRTPPQRRMLQRVINLVGPLGETLKKSFQRPHRLWFGIDRLRHQARLTRELCIAEKVIKELRGRGPKKPFANRAEPGLRRRPRLLRAFKACQQRFKINTLEVAPAIHNQRLRKTVMTPHTLT